jgi:hypothetical protein
MLDVVQDGLEKTWTMSAKKKKKKIVELEEIRAKIQELDESQIGLVLEASINPRCLPRIDVSFGQRYSYAHREMKRQLSAALQVVDEQTTSIRSDCCTAGEYDSTRNIDFKIDSDEGISFDDSIAAQQTDVSDKTGLSEDSESVVVTTSNLETDDGPLGVSITTWRRHKFSATPTQKSIGEASDEAEEADENSLEEVSISFGEGLVIRATTRTKIVRFVDVKPTVEDNIARAKELLRNARCIQNSL